MSTLSLNLVKIHRNCLSNPADKQTNKRTNNRKDPIT